MKDIRASGEFKPINAYKKTLGLTKSQRFGTVEHKFSFFIFTKITKKICRFLMEVRHSPFKYS